tara:strand:- start:163 stop:1161 length:999 start_codon:yes stop_codon:yes gene_type:complete
MNLLENLKPGSQAHAVISQAEEILAAAESVGFTKEASKLRDSISASIKNQDRNGLETNMARLQLLTPRIESESNKRKESAKNIQRAEALLPSLAAQADEVGLPLSKVQLERAYKSIRNNDSEGALDAINKLSSRIDDTLKLHATENRIPGTYQGVPAMVGEKTGAIQVGGEYIPKRANVELLKALSTPEQEEEPTPKAIGEAYGKEFTPIAKPTALDQRVTAFSDISRLKREGKFEEAANLLNAMKMGQPVIGGAYTSEAVQEESGPPDAGSALPQAQSTPSAQPPQQAQPIAQPQGLSAAQQDIFNAVKKANPNAPDEEIIKGLQSKPYFK